MTIRFDQKQLALRTERSCDLRKRRPRVRHLMQHVDQHGHIDTASEIANAKRRGLTVPERDAPLESASGQSTSKAVQHLLLDVHAMDATFGSHAFRHIDREEPHARAHLENLAAGLDQRPQ